MIFVVNSVFGTIFAGFARFALMRALPFLRMGWTVIGAEVRKPDYRHDVESRRAIEEGGRFLVGGAVWGVAFAVTGAYALLFFREALRDLLAM